MEQATAANLRSMGIVRLKEMRLNRGLSARQMAAAIGIDGRTYAAAERGDSIHPATAGYSERSKPASPITSGMGSFAVIRRSSMKTSSTSIPSPRLSRSR